MLKRVLFFSISSQAYRAKKVAEESLEYAERVKADLREARSQLEFSREELRIQIARALEYEARALEAEERERAAHDRVLNESGGDLITRTLADEVERASALGAALAREREENVRMRRRLGDVQVRCAI